MAENITIAVAQTNPTLMDNEKNLQTISEFTREAAKNGARLVVFPECALTGYIFKTRQEALPYAESIPGPSTEAITSVCASSDIYVIYGMLEKADDMLFNAAVLVGPKGVIGTYRKNHLPFLGIDRYVDPGNNGFPVFSTEIGNIGMQICYDSIFPESARVQSLAGADIIALPTNFPQLRGELLSTYIVSARALENKIYMAASDRVGTERGNTFAGLSKIAGATGDVLALASKDKEEIIYGNIDVEIARAKHVIFSPGEWEIDTSGDRRPELYGKITEQQKEK